MDLAIIPSGFNLFSFFFSQTTSIKSSFYQALSPEAEIILPIFQKWKFTKNGNLQKKKNNKKRKFNEQIYLSVKCWNVHHRSP